MGDRKRLVVLLPTKNEEEGVGEVIDRIPRNEIENLGYNLEVLVIDGDSDDSTCRVAKDKLAKVINQKTPMGKGSGFKQALTHVLDGQHQKEDILIMLDADATYHSEDIPRFIKELREYEVVWGSRLRGVIEPGAMSRINKLGNILLSLTASLVNFRRTTDLCTGYWGFRLSALNDFSLAANGFSLEAELFGAVCKGGYSSKEIVIDYDHREGQSNLKWYKDGPKIFFKILSKRLSWE